MKFFKQTFLSTITAAAILMACTDWSPSATGFTKNTAAGTKRISETISDALIPSAFAQAQKGIGHNNWKCEVLLNSTGGQFGVGQNVPSNVHLKLNEWQCMPGSLVINPITSGGNSLGSSLVCCAATAGAD